MEIEKNLAKLEEIMLWQDRKIDGIQVSSDQRTCIVVGLIDLTLEHERSIGILLKGKLYGSVFALMRLLFEAYIRSIWLRYCASQYEFEDFKKGKLEKSINDLISEIEKVQGFDVGVLSDIKKKNWKLMNDFTHGDISQAISRNTSDEITPNYLEKDVLSAINFSISVGLWATMEIASVIDDAKFAHDVFEKSKAFRNII